MATVTVAGTLRDKLAAISAAGFTAVEIFEQDFVASDMSAKDVGQLIRDNGLKLDCLQPFRDFECLPEPLRARAFARAERKFDLMGDLGTDLLMICSSVHPESLGGTDRAAEDLAELGDRAARRGLRIAYEALSWGRHINDSRDAWEIVRRADRPNVGLTLDSYHTLVRKISPESIRAIPGNKIFSVQLADAPAIEMDYMYLSRHFRNMPGEGDLDVLGFMRAALATGYDGTISLEIFNDFFRAAPSAQVAQDGHRALIHLMDQVRRCEPDLKIALPAFPAPTPVDAVASVEFATGRNEAAGLEDFLTTAGFARTGRHVSKAVDLWQQGDIRLLVNAESSALSPDASARFGTKVAEIGLMVPDAKGAAARAAALRVGVEHPPIGPDEAEIPALRGIGRSLIRLLDHGPDLSQVWEQDFRTVAPAPVGAGLTRIDHLGQTCAYDEMSSWALFYTSIFEGTKSAVVDVADPDGLVRSQVLRSGGLRITLNGADQRRTLAGQFVEQSSGSAVQHIAFACGDIFATAAALIRLGFPVLPIGANYYEDLRARFGLEPRVMARLKTFNIMYDEDAGGTFHQFYSAARPEGLFFEIVARSGTYQGFGAGNAPFRIAAQKRSRKAMGLAGE